MRLKVATVVGTRPEIIRLSRVMAALDREADHTIIHTGQNYDYELNEVFFKQLEVRTPDYFLSAAGETAAETIGNVIARSDAALRKICPEAMLVLGDTNSCMAAYAAKRLKIPVFHMEAGNRCFDERVPEEINRRVVDHISDINLTYSTIAREYLLREGLPPDRVIKTGSPMKEVLTYYRPAIEATTAIEDLHLTPFNYFVISCHREENIEPDDKFADLIDLLRNIASSYQLPVIVSTHPRTRKRLERAGLQLPETIRFLKPFGFLEYVNLQMSARAVLSDSGTITEESSILNFPAVNIREAHERPEGMEEGAVIMTGMRWERVQQALAIVASQKRGADRTLDLVRDYDTTNVSEKVVRIIHSYTDYVQRLVWRER